MSVAQRLLEAVKAAVPAVENVVIGTAGVGASVSVVPANQQSAAQATIDAFDWSAAAHALWLKREAGAVAGKTTPARLGSAVNNSTNVLADTGLEFPVKAGSHYAFEFIGAYVAAAAATGLSIAIDGPTFDAGAFGVTAQLHEGATAVRGGATGTLNTALTGQNSGGATLLPFEVRGNISPNADGTLKLRFASEVNGSQVTITRGSYGLLHCVG